MISPIGMRLEAAKRFLFDPTKVLDRAERAELSALAKFGAYVRRRAKSSIRKRRRSAEPGSPPSSHVGWIRDFLFFFVGRKKKDVVIGPILLNSVSSESDRAPELLEKGGDAVRRRYDAKRRTYGSMRRLRYRGNPFMVPAFNAELPNAPEPFRGQVKE
jgi:hypothetical protein